MNGPETVNHPLRRRVAEVLEVASGEDRLSRAVDLFLMLLITANIVAIVLESVPELHAQYADVFRGLEICSVAVFTVEYLLRVWSAVELDNARGRPALSARLRFMGRPMIVVDLLAILPFYLALLFTADLRILRILRLFRILKLTRYSLAMATLQQVLRDEAPVLGSAAFLLVLLVVLASSGIYLIEHRAQPESFGSIPAAMWWTVVTMTTVGYGDVVPVTPLGKVFGAGVSLIGIGMIALPTAILASGFARALRRDRLRFERSLDEAMEDGRLSPAERDTLGRLQRELGLSRSEAEAIFAAVISAAAASATEQRAPDRGGPAPKDRDDASADSP